jgi:hypothetical protein
MLQIAAALLLAFAHGPAPVPAQTDTAIARIRGEVAAVNAGLSRCTRDSLDVFGLSTEGGEMIVYRCGGAIRKLVTRFYGETGRAQEEWYLSGDRPLFLFRVDERYDRPFGRVVHREEERVYLRGDAMIRWLGRDGPRAPRGDDAQARLAELSDELKDLLDRARTGRTDAS